MSDSESVNDSEIEELLQRVQEVNDSDEPDLTEEEEEEEKEVPQVTFKEPSIVPLADSGKSPAEEKAEFEYIQQVASQPPPQPQPQPEVSQNLRNEVIKEISKQRAQQIQRNMYRDATQRAKEQRQVEKTIDKSGVFDEEHSENCRKMNQYKLKYRGKINFNFKTNYSIDLSPTLVKQHLREVEIILSTQDLPTVMKDFSVKLASLLESASVVLKLPWLDLSSLHERVEKNVNAGYFDEDFEQLAIKWSSWLALPVEQRVGLKFAWMIVQTAVDNKSGGRRAAPIPQEIRESFKQKTKDL